MGCCQSVDYVPIQRSTSVELDNKLVHYTRRQPNEGEIEEIADTISLETFQKNRTALLRKVEGIELDVKNSILLIRALKNDTERVEFIRNYSSNFNGLKAEDVSPLIRSSDKMAEIEKILPSVNIENP